MEIEFLFLLHCGMRGPKLTHPETVQRRTVRLTRSQVPSRTPRLFSTLFRHRFSPRSSHSHHFYSLLSPPFHSYSLSSLLLCMLKRNKSCIRWLSCIRYILVSKPLSCVLSKALSKAKLEVAFLIWRTPLVLYFRATLPAAVYRLPLTLIT